MPKRRFQCMLSEKALAELERCAGAPNKRQAWLEKILLDSARINRAFEETEYVEGNVKSEPSPQNWQRGTSVCSSCGAGLVDGHCENPVHIPPPHPNSPTGRLLRNKAKAGQLDPEVEQGARILADAAVADGLTCGGPCDHTDADHIAFDQGVAVGLCGGDASKNPYDSTANPSWREAWATGHSAGALQAPSGVVWDSNEPDAEQDMGGYAGDDPAFEADAEQAVKDASKAKREARKNRKAELGESVKGALPKVHTNKNGGQSVDAGELIVSDVGRKVAKRVGGVFQSFPKPPKRGGK